MSLKLPNDKIVYNLPEQVGVNTKNIKYLADVYKEIDSIPAQFAPMKAYFDDVMTPAFSTWTTTFEGWTTTLDTYLASMSSAAVGAIAGQNIAPANVNASGNITGASIIENMSGYSWATTSANVSRANEYMSVVKNGNKITIVYACVLTPLQTFSGFVGLGRLTIPSSVGTKLHPTPIGGLTYVLDCRSAKMFSSFDNNIDVVYRIDKVNNVELSILADLRNVVANTDYVFRYECTFLLSESLI